MSNTAEQTYFEGLSGYQPTDDSWWDLWLITWSGGDWCWRQFKSQQEAEDEMQRLKTIEPEVDFSITYVPRAGYGDYQVMGGWRFFGRDTWKQ